MAVTPGCSFTEPTFAIHPAEMLGEPLRWTSKTFIPLSRINSWTGICCAQRHGTQSMRRAALYIISPGYMVKGKSKVKSQRSKVKSVSVRRVCAQTARAPATQLEADALLTFDF